MTPAEYELLCAQLRRLAEAQLPVKASQLLTMLEHAEALRVEVERLRFESRRLLALAERLQRAMRC